MTECRRKSACAIAFACCLQAASGVAPGYESRGARSCAGWQAFRLDEKVDNPLSAQIYETWLVGYLSGLVAASNVDFLAGTANETIFRMVDAYCYANGAMNLAAAGLSVARTLSEQKGTSSAWVLP